jgi:integrase
LKIERDNISDLLQKDVRIIQSDIIEYIMKLRDEEYSYSSISGKLAAIFLFYDMNDIVLNKKKISRYAGEHEKTVKDRAYTRDEIRKIVDACDLKYKVVVLLMASTGCRIGAIPNLRLSGLKNVEEYQLYQITFYEHSKKDAYYSFCTPECGKYIYEYLQYRKRCGEKLNEKSPLIRDDFILDDLLHIENPRTLGIGAYIMYIRKILVETGLRTIVPIIATESDTNAWKKQRKEIAQNHGFRKFCHTTMANARINIEIREMLLGHSIGLSDAYYRPTSEQCLNEYLKVIDDLTINEENRLCKQVQELQEKNQDKDYIIQGKLIEKDDQIKALQESIKFLSDTVNRALLADPSNKIIYHDKDNVGTVKGIELKPEINNKAVGKIIPSKKNK